MIPADAALLRVTTALGPVDPGSPYPGFAGAGSVLEIDHPLLHAVRLARIALKIDWHGFPPYGLKRHYRGYPFDPPLANARYRVRVTAPLAGWAEGRERRLFAANGVSRFALAATGHGDVATGPLKLMLAAPAEGFGEQGYSEALIAASLRGARGEAVALPNPPWVPLIAGIALGVLPA